MKGYQFEEITLSFSIIIALLSYHYGISWLYYVYLVKSIGDFFCLIIEVRIEKNRKKLEKMKKDKKRIKEWV